MTEIASGRVTHNALCAKLLHSKRVEVARRFEKKALKRNIEFFDPFWTLVPVHEDSDTDDDSTLIQLPFTDVSASWSWGVAAIVGVAAIALGLMRVFRR